MGADGEQRTKGRRVTTTTDQPQRRRRVKIVRANRFSPAMARRMNRGEPAERDFGAGIPRVRDKHGVEHVHLCEGCCPACGDPVDDYDADVDVCVKCGAYLALGLVYPFGPPGWGPDDRSAIAGCVTQDLLDGSPVDGKKWTTADIWMANRMRQLDEAERSEDETFAKMIDASMAPEEDDDGDPA